MLVHRGMCELYSCTSPVANCGKCFRALFVTTYTHIPISPARGHSDPAVGKSRRLSLDCLTSQGLSSTELLMEEWVGKGAPSHFD